MRSRILIAGFTALLLAPPAAAPVFAEDIATYTMIVRAPPGGGYDTNARILARHMPRHLPGNPTFIVQNMPGGGGRKAAQYIDNVAPKDGSVILATDQGTVLAQAFGEQDLRYDVLKWNWIGVIDSPPYAVVINANSPVKTIADARAREVIVSASGATSISAVHPKVVNMIAGTRFKVILGYQESGQAHLAMERGEVDGIGTYNWAAVRRDGYLGKILPLVVISDHLTPDMPPGTPKLADLATNDEDKALAAFIVNAQNMAKPFTMASGLPPARVALVRAAFAATMKDPVFLAEAEKLKIDVAPIDDKQLMGIVRDVVDAPAAVRQRAASLMQEK
jgi:tripartite-type tricarboxylate transporter receptor subunit TctC